MKLDTEETAARIGAQLAEQCKGPAWDRLVARGQRMLRDDVRRRRVLTKPRRFEVRVGPSGVHRVWDNIMDGWAATDARWWSRPEAVVAAAKLNAYWEGR